jgi:hypothetical protein
MGKTTRNLSLPGICPGNRINDVQNMDVEFWPLHRSIIRHSVHKILPLGIFLNCWWFNAVPFLQDLSKSVSTLSSPTSLLSVESSYAQNDHACCLRRIITNSRFVRVPCRPCIKISYVLCASRRLFAYHSGSTEQVFVKSDIGEFYDKLSGHFLLKKVTEPVHENRFALLLAFQRTYYAYLSFYTKDKWKFSLLLDCNEKSLLFHSFDVVLYWSFALRGYYAVYFLPILARVNTFLRRRKKLACVA